MEKPADGTSRRQRFTTENSRYAIFCLLATTLLLPFILGYHFTSLNPVFPTLKVMYNHTYQTRYNETLPESTWTTLLTFSASAIIMGGFVGGVSAKFVTSYMTPLRLLQVSNVINIIAIAIMSLGSGLSGSYEAFIVGRFLSGYPAGVTYAIIPMLIAEMSVRSSQTFWQSIFGVSISFGLFAGAICGHPDILGSARLWPVLLGLAIIPSIIYLVASFHIKDTPFYLIRAGRSKEALEVLTSMRKGNEANVEKEFEEMAKEINESSTEFGIWTIITTKQYRYQLFTVLVLLANNMLCGLNNIVLYSSLVFIQAGIDEDKASYATMGIFALQFIMACIGSKIVDKLGGLKVIIGSNIIVITMLTMFTLCQALAHLSPNVLPFISIVAVAIFMMTFAGGNNLATFVLIGEITIEPTRATCFTYGNIVLWISSWLVGFLPPYLQAAFGPYAMVIWIICSVLALIYICIFLPETKGKTSDQIQAQLKLGSRLSSRSLRSTLLLEKV